MTGVRVTSVPCPGCTRRVNLTWEGRVQRHRVKAKDGYASWCSASGSMYRTPADLAADLRRARGDQGQTVTSC